MSDDLSFYHLTEQYPDEASAVRYFEQRRWPGGVKCPACSSSNVQRGTQEKRRRQLWYCGGCGKHFSVTSGTVLESTKIPLRKWLLAFHLMGASKKGMSALQLSRMAFSTLGPSYCKAEGVTMSAEQERFAPFPPETETSDDTGFGDDFVREALAGLLSPTIAINKVVPPFVLPPPPPSPRAILYLRCTTDFLRMGVLCW